jgi:hypothetical protein
MRFAYSRDAFDRGDIIMIIRIIKILTLIISSYNNRMFMFNTYSKAGFVYIMNIIIKNAVLLFRS